MTALQLMVAVGDADEALLRRSDRPVAAIRTAISAAASVCAAAVLLLLLLPRAGTDRPEIPPVTQPTTQLPITLPLIEEQGYVDIGGKGVGGDGLYTEEYVKAAHEKAIATPIPSTMPVERNVVYYGTLPDAMTDREADDLAAGLRTAFGYPEKMECRKSGGENGIATQWLYKAPDAFTGESCTVSLSEDGDFHLKLPGTYLQDFDLSSYTGRVGYAYSVIEALSERYSFKEFSVDFKEYEYTLSCCDLLFTKDNVFERLLIWLNNGSIGEVNYSVDRSTTYFEPIGDYPILTEEEARALLPTEIENDGYPSFFDFPQGMSAADLTPEDVVFGGFRYTPKIAQLHYSQPYYVFYIRVGDNAYREYQMRAVERQYFTDENPIPWA